MGPEPAKEKRIHHILLFRRHLAVILHTDFGRDKKIYEFAPGIVVEDKMADVRKKPIIIKISDLVSFDIQTIKDTVSVKLSKYLMRGLKASLTVAATTGDKKILISSFSRINDLPSWSGVIRQKVYLAKYAVKLAFKHNIYLEYKELRIYTKRFPVKVWCVPLEEEDADL